MWNPLINTCCRSSSSKIPWKLSFEYFGLWRVLISSFIHCSQERFLNETFTTKSKEIFSDVSMMLFVFDVASQQVDV